MPSCPPGEPKVNPQGRIIAAAVDAAPVALWTVDTEGTVTYASAGWAALTGLDRESLLGRAWEDGLRPDDRESARAAVRSAIVSRTGFAAEYHTGSKDQVRIVRVKAQPWMSESTLLGLVGYGLDAAELPTPEPAPRRQAPLLEAGGRLESVCDVTDGLAHEFNNLLVEIQGYADLALTEVAPDHSARQLLDSLLAAVERAQSLTRRLRTFAGGGDVSLEPVDLTALVQETLRLLGGAMSRETEVLFVPRGPVRALGDPAILREVLVHLLLNAAEAIGDGSGRISVEVRVEPLSAEQLAPLLPPVKRSGGRYACLAVSDTGCGMDEETRGRIFEPYFSTKIGGRGMGLAFCLGALRAHGGAVDVVSRPGEGTTFHLFLPAPAA